MDMHFDIFNNQIYKNTHYLLSHNTFKFNTTTLDVNDYGTRINIGASDNRISNLADLIQN
ncbi:hypothetical protein HZS_967 [Henneguya salminicola]|nr:hypothetical protein HZS_967 [Henneguya salminicola]